jgi:hypothetical protein
LSVVSSQPAGGDQMDGDAAMRAKKKQIEEEMLAQRFKLSISDDGEGNIPISYELLRHGRAINIPLHIHDSIKSLLY